MSGIQHRFGAGCIVPRDINRFMIPQPISSRMLVYLAHPVTVVKRKNLRQYVVSPAQVNEPITVQQISCASKSSAVSCVSNRRSQAQKVAQIRSFLSNRQMRLKSRLGSVEQEGVRDKVIVV